MPTTFDSTHTQEEAIELGKPYRDALSALHTQYDDTYYVADIKLMAKDETNVLLMATWTDFLPVVLPPADYVSLVTLEEPMGASVIAMADLLKLLSGKYKAVDHPTKHFVIEEIEDTELRKQILNAAKSA